MAEMMKIPVLGIVENYSYAICPDCGKAFPIFGESKVDQVASAYELPVLGKVPVHPEYAKAADEGKFHTVSNQHIQKHSGIADAGSDRNCVKSHKSGDLGPEFIQDFELTFSLQGAIMC